MVGTESLTQGSASTESLIQGVGGLFTPSDFGTVELWLKYRDVLTQTIDVDGIAQINDQSGNARHHTQSLGPAKPDSITGQNGLKMGQFDGVDDYHVGGYGLTGTALTAFTVLRINASGASRRFRVVHPVGGDDSLLNAAILMYRVSSIVTAGWRVATKSLGTTAEGGAPFILCSQFDGTNHTLWINGTAQTPVAISGSFSSLESIVGGGYDSGAFTLFSKIDVGECIDYYEDMSDTNIGNVFTELNDIWAAY